MVLTLVIDQIGQLSRDVIGRLSVKRAVKPWFHWLWRVEVSLVRFEPFFVSLTVFYW